MVLESAANKATRGHR